MLGPRGQSPACRSGPATTRLYTTTSGSCLPPPTCRGSSARHAGSRALETAMVRTDTRIGRCPMCDQNTTRAAAYADIHGSGQEPVAGKQASRPALLKVSGRLIAGAAAYVSPAAAAPCAVAADDGPRDIVKRDLQMSLASSIAEFVHGTRFGDLSETVRRVARQHLLDTVGCCLAAVRL